MASYGDGTAPELQFLPSEESAAWQLQHRQPGMDGYSPAYGSYDSSPASRDQGYSQQHLSHFQQPQLQQHQQFPHPQQYPQLPFSASPQVQSHFPPGYPNGMGPGAMQIPAAVLMQGMQGPLPPMPHPSVYAQALAMQGPVRAPHPTQPTRGFQPGRAPSMGSANASPHGGRPPFAHGLSGPAGFGESANSTPGRSTPSSSAGSAYVSRDGRAGSVANGSTPNRPNGPYGAPTTPSRSQQHGGGKGMNGSLHGARRPNAHGNSQAPAANSLASSNPATVFSRLPPLPPFPAAPAKPTASLPPAPWGMAGLFPPGQDPILAARTYIQQLEDVVAAYQEREKARVLQIEALAFDPTLALKAQREKASIGADGSVGNAQGDDSGAPAPVLGLRLLQRVQELTDENDELGRILSRKIGLDEQPDPKVEELQSELADAHALIEQLDTALTAARQKQQAAEEALAAACASNSVGFAEETSRRQSTADQTSTAAKPESTVSYAAPAPAPSPTRAPAAVPIINVPSTANLPPNPHGRGSRGRDGGGSPNPRGPTGGRSSRGGAPGSGAPHGQPRGDRRRSGSVKAPQP